jgi:hypothetical protein
MSDFFIDTLEDVLIPMSRVLKIKSKRDIRRDVPLGLFSGAGA